MNKKIIPIIAVILTGLGVVIGLLEYLSPRSGVQLSDNTSIGDCNTNIIAEGNVIVNCKNAEDRLAAAKNDLYAAPLNSPVKSEALQYLYLNRKPNEEGEVYFHDIDLSCKIMTEAEGKNCQNGANISNVNLSKTKNRYAAFLNARFKGAMIHNSSFKGAHLASSDFSTTFIEDVDFSLTALGGADFSSSNIIDVNFSNANLNYANLTNSLVAGSNFFSTNLESVNFSGTNFCVPNGRTKSVICAKITQKQLDKTWAWADNPPKFKISSSRVEELISDGWHRSNIVTSSDLHMNHLCDPKLRANKTKGIPIFQTMPKGC